VLVPAFSAVAEAALGEVPREVAAGTIVAVGRLGSRCLAQDQAGQGHDLPGADGAGGIYHRLLFRADAGRLEVLDLVTRGNLQTTLRRLRALLRELLQA